MSRARIAVGTEVVLNDRWGTHDGPFDLAALSALRGERGGIIQSIRNVPLFGPWIYLIDLHCLPVPDNVVYVLADEFDIVPADMNP